MILVSTYITYPCCCSESLVAQTTLGPVRWDSVGMKRRTANSDWVWSTPCIFPSNNVVASYRRLSCLKASRQLMGAIRRISRTVYTYRSRRAGSTAPDSLIVIVGTKMLYNGMSALAIHIVGLIGYSASRCYPPIYTVHHQTITSRVLRSC